MEQLLQNKQPTPLDAYKDIEQLINTITFAGTKDKKFVYYELDIIETALLEKEKKDRALEIIKEKNVNVGMFINCCMRIDYQFYLDHHKFIMNGMSNEEFTEEEFNLLKEVLKGE